MAAPHKALGQVAEDSHPQNSCDNVLLANKSEIGLWYAVSYDTVAWVTYSLEPTLTQAHKLGGHHKLFIKLSTRSDQFVRYQLTDCSRYSIAWNAQDAVWDVYKAP